MAVKRNESAARVLTTFELISARQPIGVSELARLLDEDKSAVQRAVVTLAEAGWIRPAASPPTRWELSAHLFTLAHLPPSANDLRRQARNLLEALRDQTGETVFLAIPDIGRFVVIDVAESPHPLRAALRTSDIIPVRGSAAARAILPYVSPDHLAAMLGNAAADAADQAEFAGTRQRGYALSVGGVLMGTTSIAAPVFDNDGLPVAAIEIAGPSDRIGDDRHDLIGGLAAAAARSLSRRAPIASPSQA